MLKIIFLGTGGSIPTPNRGMPSLMVQREGERLLFDCGEGTQRQMMKARSGFMDVTSSSSATSMPTTRWAYPACCRQ
jgi:ribonuclease Z